MRSARSAVAMATLRSAAAAVHCKFVKALSSSHLKR
jgi:hypothetical protein